MKVLRLVIGIASILAFFFIFIQSCGYTPTDTSAVSGVPGFVMGVIFLLAGATGATTRKNKVTGIIAGILYVIGAVIGFAYMDAQSNLLDWAIASAAAGAFFLVSSLVMKKDLVYGEKPKFK